MVRNIPALMLWIVILLGSKGVGIYGQGLIKEAGTQIQQITEEEEESFKEAQDEKTPITYSRRGYSICLLGGLLGATLLMVLLIVIAPDKK